LGQICPFKSENRIDFAAAPENVYGVTLPEPVLSDHELIFQLESLPCSSGVGSRSGFCPVR
jgi:hypothetical protein